MRRSHLVLGAAALLTMALGVTACSAAASSSAAGPGASRLPAAGTVTVKAGGKVVCVMTVKAGKGTCTVNTAHYAPGTLKFSASYGGGAGFKPSVSSASLMLKRATSKTRLALSTARVSYGHEQAERLTVRVVPQFAGTPAGTVTVRTVRTVRTAVCVITLVSGSGSCVLPARKLPAGSYRLIAGYPGSAGFAASVSASQPLVVTG